MADHPIPSGAREDQSWRTFVASTSITSVMAIVTGYATIGIFVISSLSVLAFVTAIWALFWSRINNRFPRLKNWVSARAPAVTGFSLPIIILLVVVLGISAAEHFSELWGPKPTTIVKTKVVTITKPVSDPAQAQKIHDLGIENKTLRTELMSRPVREITKPGICPPPVLSQAGTICPSINLSDLHLSDYVKLHAYLDPAIKSLKQQILAGDKTYAELKNIAQHGDLRRGFMSMGSPGWTQSVDLRQQDRGLESTFRLRTH